MELYHFSGTKDDMIGCFGSTFTYATYSTLGIFYFDDIGL